MPYVDRVTLDYATPQPRKPCWPSSWTLLDYLLALSVALVSSVFLMFLLVIVAQVLYSFGD